MSIIYFYALKFTCNSPVRIYGIRSVKYDSIKGQVRCIQTLTAQVTSRSAFARNVEVLLVFFR
jgi:hypothetical protein